VGPQSILGLFQPGSHGSTYGGNPLGCAVARAALEVMHDEDLVERSRELGKWLLETLLEEVRHPSIVDIRGRGLLVGIELDERARPRCEALQERGVLCKETHDYVIRFAPPLVATRDDLRFAVDRIRDVFAN
jgi:ornithine--oxo-acid transaminase